MSSAAAAETCVFCSIVAGTEPATVVYRWDDAIAIVPLGPVTSGHLLVIPAAHVQDYTSDPKVSAIVMERAAEIAPYPSNVITSAGREATQSVTHLHLHIVPRQAGDGLALPWDDRCCWCGTWCVRRNAHRGGGSDG